MTSVYFKSMFLFCSLFGIAYKLGTYNNEKDVSLMVQEGGEAPVSLTVVMVSIPTNACCTNASSIGIGLPLSRNNSFRLSKQVRKHAHEPSNDLQQNIDNNLSLSN
jgi:hypothetical protein